MKKRVLALSLSLALCLGLFPAALAAGAAFSDVPAGSWFEQGVTTCAQMGVMVGTGTGLFSPDTELTAAECLTLAVRLYDIRRGGDGTLQKAPEEWGKYTLALADGETFYRYGERNLFFGSTRFDEAAPDGGDLYAVYVQTPGNTAQEREDYAKSHEGPAVLTAEGKTYSGTVVADSTYDGPCLRFSCDGVLHTGDLLSDCKPGPDRWYRDAVYTAERLGLREAEGFSTLLAWLSNYQPDTFRADRESFARALAVAAGTLEKKYDVPSIPDMERSEHNESIYGLYEAGILNGTDQFGTFQKRKHLTRAECAVMVARVLDESQRLTSPPAAPDAYQQAVIDLRSGFTYYEPSERTYETEDCTVFVYDRGGAMHTGPGNITIIYKPGSQPGAGTRIDGERPYPLLTYNQGAETVRLSEDQKSFIYTYRLDRSAGDPVQEAGIYTYTVDLPTGTVTHTYSPFSYEGLTDLLANGRNYTLEQRLEAPSCTVLLRWKPLTWVNDTRDYELWLSYKDPEAQEPTQKLLLPSTVHRDSGYAPTDRAPDSLELSGDGRTLTYVYRFDEALSYKDTVYHEAGTYIYTVDLATGELSVELLPPYEAAVADIFQSDSFQLDRRLETSQCSIIAGTYRAAHIPRACVILVYKSGSLPGGGTRVFLPTQGGVDTSYSSILPDTMDLSQDGTTLTYTYHFDADGYALDKTYTEHLTQAAGTHTYTVDLITGEYTYTHTEN